MSEQIDGNERTFIAGGAIAQHLRVTFSTGKLAAAGITARELGTITRASFADGDRRAVRLRTANGTCKMVAGASISVGDLVYTAANGKVGASAATAYLIGTALSAGGDGEIIEVLRNSHGDTAV